MMGTDDPFATQMASSIKTIAEPIQSDLASALEGSQNFDRLERALFGEACLFSSDQFRVLKKLEKFAKPKKFTGAS